MAETRDEADPTVVAVIGSVFPIPPEAGTSRPFELLKRIAARTPVHCLGVVSQSPEEWERFRERPELRQVFTSTSAFYSKGEVSPLARGLALLGAPPPFDQRWRDPSVLRAAHARARALVRAHGPVVFYCLERDTLQYVPRDLWVSTLWDLVDAPLLAAERRLAVDDLLSAWERVKLRASLAPLRRYERRALRRVGRAVLSSSADIVVLRERMPDVAIANVIDGADVEYFSPRHVPASDRAEAACDLLFFGNLAHPPNADAAVHLVRDIMPLVWRGRPNARAVVVGPDPPEALRGLQDGRRVLVTGFVPDVRPQLARATVVVSPLRFGTGMKNKLQVALAMEKATVASPVTCEGFELLEPGVHALVADGAQEIARATLSLLDDPVRRRALGLAGAALIRAHYGWDAAAGILWENLRHLAAADARAETGATAATGTRTL